MFIHGFAHTAGVWRPVIDELPSSLDVLSVDLRGHGSSGRDPEGRYHLDQYTADVGHILSSEWRPSCVVGHSLGGKVAMMLAARLPELVSSLVVVDAAPQLARNGVRQVLSDVAGMRFGFDAVDDYLPDLEAMYPLAKREVLVQMAHDELQPATQGPFRYVRKLDPIFGDPSFVETSTANPPAEMWELLRLLDQPTLVCRGVASAMVSSAVASRMANDAIRDARVATIPRSGHAIPVDNPVDLAAAIDEFLSTLS